MLITDIQRGCTHDGPGLRTTVFFKGCPLRCPWCHNPETKKPGQELLFRREQCIFCMECLPVCPVDAHSITGGQHTVDRSRCVGCMQCVQACPAGALEAAGQDVTVRQVLEQVLEDRVFYRNSGGLTVSGGEPTLQHAELLQLLTEAKRAGIHTCLETCGVFSASLAEPLAACTDLFLFDIKDTDPVRLRQNTGAKLEAIEKNLLALDALGAKTVLRCLLIPEVNMNEAHAKALAALYRRLKNCQAVELLAYHPYGLSKSAQLGREDPRFTQPEPAQMEAFARWLTDDKIPTKLFGSIIK